MVLAVANNKGGVAKTTTALNIALALADTHKKRVLLVDMNAQGSLTRLLPPEGHGAVTAQPVETATLTNHFASRAKLAQVLRGTRFDNIWLVPANGDLSHLDKGGGSHPQEELAFARAVHDVTVLPSDGLPFDWIILDTPPAQTYYTRLAVGASHRVLVPANAETLAVLGATRALQTAVAMHALMGTGAAVVGGS
jgi:chromosome partitioning protein